MNTKNLSVKIQQKLLRKWGALKNLLSVKKFFRTLVYHLRWHTMFKTKFAGLHVGSGNTRIPSFLNIDTSWFVDTDVTAEITKIHVADNSVKILYGSHVFEHMDRTRALAILSEWRRVLAPGGKLFLAVPDLEKLFTLYLENIAHYESEEARLKADKACRIIYGGQTNAYDYHYYGYSFVTLQFLLKKVGFTEVSLFAPRVAKLVPENADSSFASISLNVVATK